LNLTFLNSAFLFAALAALLPLVIHLISRRRVRTIDFSSLQFLKELERKKIRRVRIRQILLLIVRSLIILAAALALARPTLTGPLGAGAGHARTSIGVVVDVSASMSREGERGRLFEQAVAAGRKVAGLLDDGDQAFLVTAGDPPRSVIPGGTLSGETLLRALDGLAPGASGTDYGGAVALATELLAGARDLNRELFIIGDLQRTGWLKEDPASPNDARTGQGALSAIRAYVLPVVGPSSNLGVSSVSVLRRYGGTAGLYSVSAEISNRGRRPVEAPVKLFVDGTQVGQTGVALEAGESAAVRFSTAVDESEWHWGWVELPADGFGADDRRYFAIAPARRMEVLIVRPPGAATRDDAYYIGAALDPTGAGERFRPVEVEAARLAAQERGRFPVVILADVGRLNASGEKWLERHLGDGGGVLVVLGNRTDVRYWNAGTLPCSELVALREPYDRPDGIRIAPAAGGGPLLEGLVFGERLIDDVVVKRGFAPASVRGGSVLEVPGLGPVLVVGRSGGGEAAVLLTGVDSSWSSLPRSGFIVPLLDRVVRRLAGVSERVGRGGVGGDLFVPFDAPPDGRVEVLLPSGNVALPELRAGARPGAFLRDVAEPGVYRFTSDGEVVALGVVNVDTLESDLAPASRAEVEKWLAPYAPRFVDVGSDLAEDILEARYGRELWRVLLYGALGLLALEMYLARPRVE